ncbi:MAG TPA: SURF1 family protein [Burkholderiaceae bacterium]|nr:SURF1 family protein [Burkholderiaceae bacterium]
MPRSKLIFAWVAAAIGIAAAISLGNWQTRRGDEKVALQAQADAAERAALLQIEATRESIETVARSLPRRVRVTGVFDPTGTVLLDNRMLGAVVGYQIITPLLLGDGLPAVLIDRGWKARGADQRLDTPTPPAGPVTVEGLAVPRPSTLLELGSTPKLNVPGIWQNLDYEAYEKVAKRSVARFVVRQAAAGAADGLRREWPAPSSGVDKHRGYAFQWYALAALILALAGYFGWKSWRQR